MRFLPRNAKLSDSWISELHWRLASTGGYWPLLTIMLLSWLRTTCVL